MQKSQIAVAGLYTLFVFIKVALLRLTDTVCSNSDEQVNLACDQVYMHCMHIYRHLWSLHFSMLALLNLHILTDSIAYETSSPNHCLHSPHNIVGFC